MGIGGWGNLAYCFVSFSLQAFYIHSRSWGIQRASSTDKLISSLVVQCHINTESTKVNLLEGDIESGVPASDRPPSGRAQSSPVTCQPGPGALHPVWGRSSLRLTFGSWPTCALPPLCSSEVLSVTFPAFLRGLEAVFRVELLGFPKPRDGHHRAGAEDSPWARTTVYLNRRPGSGARPTSQILDLGTCPLTPNRW